MATVRELIEAAGLSDRQKASAYLGLRTAFKVRPGTDLDSIADNVVVIVVGCVIRAVKKTVV